MNREGRAVSFLRRVVDFYESPEASDIDATHSLLKEIHGFLDSRCANCGDTLTRTEIKRVEGKRVCDVCGDILKARGEE